MRKLLLCIYLLVIFINPVFANESICKNIANTFNFDDLKKEIIVVSSVKYLDVAQSIKFIVGNNKLDNLIPRARLSFDGEKKIYLSKNSIELICNLTLPAAIAIRNLEGDSSKNLDMLFENVVAPSMLENHGCDKNNEKVYSECLLDFSRIIQKKSEVVLSNLDHKKPLIVQAVGYDLKNAVRSIVLHEASHFFLDHFQKIRNKEILRSQAEYEADMFAMLTSLEMGVDSTSYLEFFHILGYFESNYNTAKSEAYSSTEQVDSSECRFRNAALIESHTGRGGSLLLLKLLEKGNDKTNNIKFLEKLKEKIALIAKLPKVEVCNDEIYPEVREISKDIIELFDFFIVHGGIFYGNKNANENKEEIAPLDGNSETIFNAIESFSAYMTEESRLKQYKAKLLLTMINRLSASDIAFPNEHKKKIELIGFIKKMLSKIIGNGSVYDTQKAMRLLSITNQAEKYLMENSTKAK